MAVRTGPLSRDLILAAAMAVADAEGIRAVTMRRVAAEVGVEAMSLYHHLPGKDALVDGLVETVIGEVIAEAAGSSDEGAPESWRADLRARILAARRVMLRHPWAPGLVGQRPTIPPIAYAHYEAILATLVRGGFSYHLGHQALHSLGTMTLGFAPQVFDVANAAAEAAADAAEVDMARMAELLPNLTAMAASELHAATDPSLGWCDSSTEFEFTLDLLLDGLGRARC